MKDQPFQRWKNALPNEVEFWRQIISGEFPNADWCADMRQRIAGKTPFPGHIGKYLKPETVTRILDVGSGPVTCVGNVHAPSPIKVVAIDPLGDTYGKLLKAEGLTPYNVTLQGESERLSELNIGLFDVVYSRNALDHAYDPIRAIRQMPAVCKLDGVVFLEGSANESVKQHGQGLHQWNFLPLDNGDLVVWQLDNPGISLRSAFGREASLHATGDAWYQAEIRP
jgi:SAM-dependent methyltransferase